MARVTLPKEAKETIRKNVKFLLTMQMPLAEKLDKIIKPRLLGALRASAGLLRPSGEVKTEEKTKPKQWVGRVKRLAKARKAISKRDGFISAPKLTANNAIVNKEGQTNLMHACIYGNVELIRELLEQGADVNHEDWNGKTALVYAVQFNQLESVRELLRHPDIQTTQKFGETSETVLVKAVKNKQVPIIALLLSQSDLVNKRDIKGRAPLYHAVVLGQGLIVRLLMDAGSNAEDLHDYGGTNALDVAIENNEVDSVRALVFHQNFILEKKLGARIAIMATYLQDLEMMKELKQKGCKFEGLCPESHLPCLFIAYNLGFKPIVDFLISVVTHSILETIVPSGDNLLTLATRKSDFNFISQVLRETSINVNQQDSMKKTALMIAAETGESRIIRLLLDYKADVDLQDSHYRTALMECAMAGHDGCLSLILSAMPRTCLQDQRGRMAMDLAKTDWAFETILEYMYAHPEKQTYEFNERVKRGLVLANRGGRNLSRQVSSSYLLRGSSTMMTDESRKTVPRPNTARASSGRSTVQVLRELSMGRKFHELVDEAFS